MPFLAEKHVPIPTQDLLSWMFDNAPYDQDKPIYIDAANPSASISARQARSLIRKIAAGLRARGIGPGDCVLLQSFNDISYPVLVLGVIASGASFTGCNPGYQHYELCHHVKVTQAKLLLVEPELLPGMLKAGSQAGIDEKNVLVFNTNGRALPAGRTSWSTLLEHGERDWVRFDSEHTARNTDAMRLTTSGTTGLPKAARLSHYNFVAQHTVVWERVTKPYEPRFLIALPMFHAAMAPVTHTSALRAGTPTYILRRFELEPYLAAIEKFQITETIMVPPVVYRIVQSPLSKTYSLKSLRYLSVGAAALDASVQAELQRLMDEQHGTFTQLWGMTETCCVASQFDYPEKDGTGSVGRFMPNLDVKLVDDDGKDISGYDVRGELCVKGSTVTRGYLDNPDANKLSYDEDGYFKTGDILYCDGKTKLWYIVDRKKELLKVRGYQVDPPELEAVLVSHPLVADAAVIGVSLPGEESELPRAYIAKKPGPKAAKLTEEEVKQFMAGKLAKYKRLDGGVQFVPEVPRTPSGKILKRVLREQAKREIGARL